MIFFTWNDILQINNAHSPYCNYFSKNNCLNGSALTIGGFDGMHRGHQALFNKVLCQLNKRAVSKTGVVTFVQSPRAIKQKDNFPGHLSTENLRKEYFERLKFDFCILIDFSTDFSKMKGLDFLTVLRNSCSMQYLTVGTNFRCGRGLDTGVFEIEHYCLQYGIQFSVCAEVLYKDMRISSSAVRSAVQKGDIKFAADLLGYNYILDASAFKWRSIKTENMKTKLVSKTCIAHKSDSLQVLPPAGTYPVHAAGFDTLLYVDSKFLRLDIPLEQISPATVTKIEFIKPMKE